MPTQEDIGGYYKKYLGRDLVNPGEAQGWLGNADAENMIKNSGEGQAYAAQQLSPQQPAAAAQPLAPATQADQWGNAPGSQQGQIDAFWNQVTNQKRNDFTPQELQGWGVQQLSPDKYRLPNGQEVDTVRDIGGANQAFGQWTISGGRPGENGQGGVGGNGGGGQGGGGGLDVSTGFQSGTPGGAGVDPQMREYLLRLLGRSEPGAIDVNNDPNLKSQADAYSSARNRSAQRERAQLAERAAFTGLNSGGQGSGAFEQGLGGIQENAGRDIAGQQAGLVGQEVQARRQDLINGLQIANSVGARDQSAQLQQQLAELDNQYRYASLGQNQSQFNDQYGLNLATLQQNANRDAYLQLLQGGG